GRKEAAGQAVAWGVISTVAMLAIGTVLPEHTPNVALPALGAFGVNQIAKAKQGAYLEMSFAAGAPKQSNWRVAAIALGSMATLVGTIVVFGRVFPNRNGGEDGVPA